MLASKTVHVATPYNNPCRWNVRRDLLRDYQERMASTRNVVLHTGEMAFGGRPWEVTNSVDPNHLQLRSKSELWLKENLANLIVQRFPHDWEYGAIVDGDVQFSRNDWGLEAIHLLQHYDFVQLFSGYTDLDHLQRPFRVSPSFTYSWIRNGRQVPDNYSLAVSGKFAKTATKGYEQTQSGLISSGKSKSGVGATGLAWAFRRDAFDKVGGFLDTCILGSGDWHMAFALIGTLYEHAEVSHCTSAHVRKILEWHERARAIKANVHYLDQHALHYFHGSKLLRGYGERWKILAEEKFDPNIDIQRDWQGIWQLSGNKPRLRDRIRDYFLSRREDDECSHPIYEAPLI